MKKQLQEICKARFEIYDSEINDKVRLFQVVEFWGFNSSRQPYGRLILRDFEDNQIEKFQILFGSRFGREDSVFITFEKLAANIDFIADKFNQGFRVKQDKTVHQNKVLNCPILALGGQKIELHKL